MVNKMERQPLSVSIKELRDLADELEKQRQEAIHTLGLNYKVTNKWQVDIIRKNEFSNWELEK